MQEMWVHSLGQENPLEKGMATHSKILAWEIPWTEEPGGLHIPRDGKDLNTTKRLSTHTHHHLQEAFFLPPSCSFSLQISTIHYVLVQMREALVDVVQRTRGSDPYSTMNCVNSKPKANCLPLINAVTGTSSPFQRADVHLVPQLT